MEMTTAVPQMELATAGLALSITDGGKSQWIFGRMVFRSVNGQGLGAFAIHQYEKGERILAERPLASIAVPDKGRISKKEAKLLVDKVIGSLGESQRLAFFSLSQHPSFGDEQSAIGTWLSNVYPTVAARDSNNPSGCDGMGAFAELSRQSCVHAQYYGAVAPRVELPHIAGRARHSLRRGAHSGIPRPRRHQRHGAV
jgi:hypothetical protein